MTVRTRLAVAWGLFALATAGVGRFHWPYFVREHRRIDPSRTVLIWFSEGMAVLWFLWFGLVHIVLARPLPPAREDEPLFDREHCFLLTLFLLGLGMDGLVTWQTKMEEEEALERAEVVQGEIVGVVLRPHSWSDLIHCRFQDRNGDEYRVDYPWNGSNNAEF